MRFLLGVLVGYSMRGKKKLLITVLATVAFTVYIILPAIALLALRLDVQRERQSRPVLTRVPAIKDLSFEDAKAKLHTSHLNIRLLASRRNLPRPPGVVVDQNPQPGEEVIYGYPVGVVVIKERSQESVVTTNFFPNMPERQNCCSQILSVQHSYSFKCGFRYSSMYSIERLTSSPKRIDFGI